MRGLADAHGAVAFAKLALRRTVAVLVAVVLDFEKRAEAVVRGAPRDAADFELVRLHKRRAEAELLGVGDVGKRVAIAKLGARALRGDVGVAQAHHPTHDVWIFLEVCAVVFVVFLHTRMAITDRARALAVPPRVSAPVPLHQPRLHAGKVVN